MYAYNKLVRGGGGRVAKGKGRKKDMRDKARITPVPMERVITETVFYILRSLETDSASQCSLAGRYDTPIPTPFLAPIDCLKIPALI
jgi:hypothetical protein